MNRARSSKNFVQGFAFLAVGLLLALCASLLHGLDEQRPAATRAKELMYLPKGKYLRVAALGYNQVAADILWIKAVQHFGNMYEPAEGYRWAYHAVDVLTDVDPKFSYSYQATGTVLTVHAHQIQESNQILSKGMRNNPEVWELPYLIGYNHYFELCDPAEGAKYLQIASSLPGAPSYLPQLAARMRVEAGDPDAAIEFLVRFIDQTRDERVREGLVERLKEVVTERNIRVLEGAVLRYRSMLGRLPMKLQDLVTRGLIEKIPTEPLGGVYELNSDDGHVASTKLRERLRVHRTTACRSTPKT